MGGYLSGVKIMATLVLAFLLHLLFLPGLIAGAIYSGGIALVTLSALVLKSLFDGAILGRGAGLIGRKINVFGLAVFELFFIAYTLIVGVHGVFRPRKVVWKGRAYS
jgi:hypothetical protein